MLTISRQIELTTRAASLLHGPGTDYQVEAFTPWRSPDARVADAPGPFGVLPGFDSDGGRLLVATVDFGGVLEELDPLWSVLESMWSLQPVDAALSWLIGTRERMHFGRCRGADGTENSDGLFIGAECRFLATDARRYGPLDEFTTDDVTTAAGEGTRPTRAWSATVEGPVTEPVFGYQSVSADGTIVDRIVAFDTTLVEGQSLTVDAHAGVCSITTDGVTSYAINSHRRDEDDRLAPLLPAPAGERRWTFSSTAGATEATFLVRDCVG